MGDIVSNFLQLLNMPALPASWVLGIRSTQDWTYALFYHWSFILLGIVIIINRSDLQSLNIDVAFTAIFAAASLSYWKYYRWPSGWIALLIPIVIYIFYMRKELKFEKFDPTVGQITMIVVIGFFLGLLYKYDSLTTKIILEVTHIIATQVPFTLVEEVLFRGLLWKFLTNLDLSALQIIALQALIFWLSHTAYMFTYPVIFWISLPITSIILGVIVWRSKSITVSSFAHIFSNFLLAIYHM